MGHVVQDDKIEELSHSIESFEANSVIEANSAEAALWVNDIKAELNGNCSDRTLVILAGSALDELLEKILKVFFILTNKSFEGSLFGGTGALNTFSAKIKLCYALGLISRSEYSDLLLIRKIRNEFAHAARRVTFSERAIIQCCRRLKPYGHLLSTKQKTSIGNPDDAKALFKNAALMLLGLLSCRYTAANQNRCSPASDIDKVNKEYR